MNFLGEKYMKFDMLKNYHNKLSQAYTLNNFTTHVTIISNNRSWENSIIFKKFINKNKFIF